MADFYRDGFNDEIILFYLQSDHAGTAVQGFVLVEDEVANAVVDLLASEIFDGLLGVGMVAYQDVSTCLYQLVSLPSLMGYGLQRVFTTPME